MRVLVLGAGVVGVTSAWYLAEAGHEVTVIDRQTGPAMETSFANGGQISVSHAEPWANPGAPLQALKWLGHEDAPLLWRLRADPAQWLWGLQFLGQCSAARTRANVAAIVRLALYSRNGLQELRHQLGLAYAQLERGILHVYTDASVFSHALTQSEMMREFGCERQPKSADECLAIEPALRHSGVRIVGGTYTADDESGDACLFTQHLATKCAAKGVNFRFSAEVRRILVSGEKIRSVALVDGNLLDADAYVVALGSYTPLLLRPLGMCLPICPAKGYSITIPLEDDSVAPTVSVTDDEYKMVFSRLGQRLRVAGTAEFSGYDSSVNANRCAAIERRAAMLFPQLRVGQAIERWAGLRPATPGNVPLIGPTRYPNLFVNSGHGTLGWTLACGSGRLLADLVSRRATEIDAGAYALTS